MKLQRHRGILTWLAFSMIIAVSGAFGGYLWFVRLPHPSEASQRELFRWLVQRNLVEEPFEIRLALLDRLEKELEQKIDVSEVREQLSDSQLSRLKTNIELLKRDWFVSRADNYAELSSEERSDFLKAQIVVLTTFSSLRFEANDGHPRSRFDTLESFFNMIESLIDAADAETRQRMLAVVRDGVVCWLSTNDLSQESHAIQLGLIDRFEDSEEDVQSGNSTTLTWSQEDVEQLRRNSLLLQRVWFTDRAQRLVQLPASERKRYLIDQINIVKRWSAIRLPEPEATATRPTFFQRIEEWIEQATSQEQTAMRQAVRDGVVCWLATQDLGEHSMTFRQELAIRIALALDDAQAKQLSPTSFSEEETRQIRKNSQLLAEAWFHTISLQYADMPEAERDAYVTHQVQRFLKWDVIRLLTKSGSEQTSTFSTLLELSMMTQKWLERSEPGQREHLRKLLQHVRGTLMRM